MVPAALTDSDRHFLRRALELAEGGRGKVSPNPLVGAVIARGEQVIGEGFHAALGGPHAERAALDECRRRGVEVAGATIFVTLEPCAHEGRQPPCAPALAEAGIARVVYASEDPSAKTAGRGPALLRERGVEVVLADGAEAQLARRLNPSFRKHAIASRPLITYKCAASLDGRTATADGHSKWISGAESRRLVHRWRASSDAVAVGIGTALADDPLLTAREVEAARQPVRVVFDSKLRLAPGSALARDVETAPVIVIAAAGADPERAKRLVELGVEVLEIAGEPTQRLGSALETLASREITSVLLEGGATLAGAFLDAGEIDELRLFVAPILLGGKGASNVIDGSGIGSVANAVRPLRVDSEPVGEDILISAQIKDF